MDYYRRCTVTLNFHAISYTPSVNIVINDSVIYLAFGH